MLCSPNFIFLFRWNKLYGFLWLTLYFFEGLYLIDSPDRIEIRRRILRALVKDFGHATLESLNDSDTQQNSDSDSDEYMASPEEVGRILTCDNDSDNNADAI